MLRGFDVGEGIDFGRFHAPFTAARYRMVMPHAWREELDIDTTGGESAFVLRFFHVNGGSLKCRVTDVRCMQSWLIAEPDELRALLLRLQTPGQVPERIDTQNA
jgi:hypothetical protein